MRAHAGRRDDAVLAHATIVRRGLMENPIDGAVLTVTC
jgi:hypothetical protein